MGVIEQARERYLRTPRLVATADGGAVLHAIAWERDVERVLAWTLDAEGAVVGEPREVARAAAIPDYRVTGEVVDDPAVEDLAVADEGVSAHVAHDGAQSTVVLERGGEVIKVWEARGFASAPAVAVV